MKFYYQLFFFLISVVSMAQSSQLWKGYYSYQETKAATQDNQNIYIATDNAVFAYNQYSFETEIYNTVSGLKIDGINTLAYAEDYKKLIVGSTNGKIAIIDLAADKIYHLNDIYSKTNIPDNQKIINKIIVQGGYAYLATGYGITTVRLNDNHFGDTFYIGVDGEMVNVKSITVFNNQLYAAVENEGLKKASINSNLIDYNNWQVIDFNNWIELTTFADKLIGVKEDLSLNTISASNQIDKVGDVWGGFLKFNVSGDVLIEVTQEAARLHASDLSVYNEFVYSLNEKGGVNDAIYSNGYYYIASKVNGGLKVSLENKENIESVSPGGPLSNNVSSATINNNDLWITFGGYGVVMDPYKPNGLTQYGISALKNMQSWQHISFNELNQFKSTVNISFNPRQPNLAYISSFHDGLGIWDLNKKELTVYNAANTNELNAILEGDTRVYGVAFDKNGTGWMTNTATSNDSYLVSIDKNNQFTQHSSNVINGSNFLMPVIDKNNTKWFGSYANGLFAFNETKNKAMQIMTSDNLPSTNVKTLALDYNNTLWIGTLKGLRIIRNVDQFLTSPQLTPTNIVIVDEGLNQELFFEQDILNITVDGSNNKWVSVADSGVFLISDKNETLYNFTTANSPLPSNNVISITINGTTGEVFFVTREGMVSFKNFATTPSENLDNIKVYPNPVKPGFTGDVKISGLVADATVKITDVAGNLVHETKSLGGTVTWNTLSFSGSKVPSGVYMIFITSQDGTLDAVKKVMIIR
ncbi:T9SS type A sorting domain-containing protein [Flavobacterium dauae]|uniref:type IX secretion system anionic LPS delivery protein PorZ n=1 Tax=Flavobacterium dauae TaxID=1563479 RepID=UPI00101B35CB|nr:T9SS type A sorting domain-containing protein [Flavobacterium dauae]WLD23962.1 T9SS type A sorting domain-containing protein [Flavobacterium dauae]